MPLAAERRELKLTAFNERRDLTAGEIARRKEIGATRSELADALEDLALETLDRLDNASDLDALLLKIAAINDGLTDDLEHLRTIAGYAELAAKILAGFATAVDKLTELRPSLI